MFQKHYAQRWRSAAAEGGWQEQQVRPHLAEVEVPQCMRREDQFIRGNFKPAAAAIQTSMRVEKTRGQFQHYNIFFGLLQTSALRDLLLCSVPRHGPRSLPSYKHRIGKLELSPDLYAGGASGTHPATKRPIFDGPLKLPVALLDFLSASGVLRKQCNGVCWNVRTDPVHF